MFIELHLIQNFAPSNLNRDDTGNPKDCEFGGHRRARISSQSLKRAIRHEPVFAQTTTVDNGERSKRMTKRIVEKLVAAGKPEPEAQLVANGIVAAYYSKKESMDEKKPNRTQYLVYFSHAEIDVLVKKILEGWNTALATVQSKKPSLADLVAPLVKETKNRSSAPDIALFGRMLADKTELNIDAACQVAHAISTHRISMEMDFYTAVDELQDLTEDEGAGAGMMGFTNFNSACFYRYARLDWEKLKENLGWRNAEDAKPQEQKAIKEQNVDAIVLANKTVEGFLRAALDAIPTGKQNGFAAQNPTNMAVAIVREDGKSWNLANAFEEPVRPQRDNGLIRSSIEALDTYWGDLTRRRDDAKFTTVAVYTDSAKSAQPLKELAGYHQPTLSAWVNAIMEKLPTE
jgi:CRISPR system Cascade subunit CasC